MSSAETIHDPCVDCHGSGVREIRGGSLETGAYQPCPSCRGYGQHLEDPDHDRLLRQSVLVLLLAVVIVAAFAYLAVT